MKFLTKILFILILFIIPFASNSIYAIDTNINTANIKIGSPASSNGVIKDNTALKNLKNATTDYTVDISKSGQVGIYNSIIRIARDLKNLFFLISGVYFLLIVLRLMFSEKTEEEVSNFKKGIIWISMGIIITQISYYMINILFDKNINVSLATNFIDIIIQPLIRLLETSASFIFIGIMIYAFFKIVTSNGDEEKAKSGKMSVLYAIVGFIVIKISAKLVDSVYSKVSCSSVGGVNCTSNIEVTGAAEIVVSIINWMNSFIGLIVVILIIYAGFMVLTSIGDEEKLKKAKNIILYIAIGLFILVANYLILTFIITPTNSGIL